MLEAKYFRDYKHNYMILQCGQEAAVRSYQYKILTSDKIREILKCSIRHINGTTYYYYDISSRTTLQSLYQSTKMSCEQVRDLLWQIHGICDKLAGFFMEESGLVLLPEHIYYDFSSQKYIGLYYPDYQGDGAAYEPLMNFLLEHIDTEDRQLAENMYRICEIASEPHFLIEDALQILEERNEVKQEEAPDVHIPDKEEPFPGTGEFPPVELPKEEQRKTERSLLYPVFAVLSVLGAAGAAAVCYLYDLAQEEKIALYGIMAVLGGCFLFSVWGMIRNKRNSREVEEEKTEKADRMFEESFVEMTATMPDAIAGGIAAGTSAKDMPGMVFQHTDRNLYSTREREGGSSSYAEKKNVSLERVLSRDMNLETMTPWPDSVRSMPMPSAAQSLSREQENDYYGNTIFFDESRAAEHKLYAVDRRNKQHIQLTQFPCTIGKMAGCVDYVLADSSVSRIHAKFDRQGDKILMTDMNSTNGTYKNGLRMQPQETVEIEPGDEIRFGNLNYCYR